ncbi:hypothetical protein L226DRAFT_25519 [Lentinus tigrinus ALCF2SS1-7]|uniref:uncharacterized protein n=1 Tax=Lentinus tigrinus ALCF2SS1-7 TaxID=1328758 RepID=UPI00116601B1|nr:hypothetical protein L226DRAFT_25519 [Lentinus tigrinus ALCF2SS1-7]
MRGHHGRRSGRVRRTGGRSRRADHGESDSLGGEEGETDKEAGRMEDKYETTGRHIRLDNRSARQLKWPPWSLLTYIHGTCSFPSPASRFPSILPLRLLPRATSRAVSSFSRTSTRPPRPPRAAADTSKPSPTCPHSHRTSHAHRAQPSADAHLLSALLSTRARPYPASCVLHPPPERGLS